MILFKSATELFGDREQRKNENLLCAPSWSHEWCVGFSNSAESKRRFMAEALLFIRALSLYFIKPISQCRRGGRGIFANLTFSLLAIWSLGRSGVAPTCTPKNTCIIVAFAGKPPTSHVITPPKSFRYLLISFQRLTPAVWTSASRENPLIPTTSNWPTLCAQTDTLCVSDNEIWIYCT